MCRHELDIRYPCLLSTEIKTFVTPHSRDSPVAKGSPERLELCVIMEDVHTYWLAGNPCEHVHVLRNML